MFDQTSHMSHVYTGHRNYARVRMFEWLYLSELASEIIYKISFVFEHSMIIQGYIQN